MTVILVLLMFSLFIGIDFYRAHKAHALPKGTMITTPGYEMLGAMAQDGGALLHYKASQMVKITGRDGVVHYGQPRHVPMLGWNDYYLVPTEEVEQDGGEKIKK